MNTCENCGNKGKGHEEHPCVACVSYGKWEAPGDEMRELAIRLAKETGAWTYFDIDSVYDCDVDAIERLVRAAVVEGMMRAADACEEYQGSAEACAIVIRAEAERING